MTQRLMASRRLIASRTTSRKVWSAAAVIAVRKRAAERAVGVPRAVEQHRKRQLLQKLRLLGFVEHGEAGGDIGLERKLVQELRAEGMDGLHFQSARCLQRAREQPPRQRPPPDVGHHVRSVMDHVVERGIVERRPFGERVEDALGHVGGGGLGEGDAEDFFRLDALEQQIDHALRQHMRLARAGIGGEPRRYVGIGHRPLHPAYRMGMPSGDLIRRLHVVDLAAGFGPFLDARKMIVVAVMCRHIGWTSER